MFTHKDRIFVNKKHNVNQINEQLLATCDTWFRWFMVNRSVTTSVNHRSHAEVLQSHCKNNSAIGRDKFHKCQPNKVKSSTGMSIVHSSVNCVPVKCIPPQRIPQKLVTNHKASARERNVVSKGKPYMQESSLSLQSRYEVLQSIVHREPQHLSHQHGNLLHETLESNNNKNSKTVGEKLCGKHTSDVTALVTSRGNQNKTGTKLGQVTQEVPHLGQPMHHITDSRGNKNGIGAKLGQVLYQRAGHNQSCTENKAQKALPHNDLIQVQDIQDISTCHDLACVEEKNNDNYVYLYDVSNFPARRKCNIPHYIYQEKLLSQDYVTCVRQNGKDFGFLPLNNLMVYTGAGQSCLLLLKLIILLESLLSLILWGLGSLWLVNSILMLGNFTLLNIGINKL